MDAKKKGREEKKRFYEEQQCGTPNRRMAEKGEGGEGGEKKEKTKREK